MPTYAINDLGEGLATKPPRVGEAPYEYRFRVGWEREWRNGRRVWVRVGAENKHVGAFEIGVRIPIGR